jgi:lipopolysaccharide transport system ATP-binding protein
MNSRSNGQYPPEAAIVVENLGKQYHIGLQEKRHDTLLQSMLGWIASPVNNFRQLRRLSRVDEDEAEDIIWALRDVSFTVNQGEVVGIIGRNGAGKSTLLKILSRITPPTTGQVILNGRVSSLLEVGTGFHPELTGRENVYLNGTILGMTKAEVDRKFDEIVAFAEVEKFIDTPVKRYSSGMRVRLAFAVSAHLESEILLVDEVLAVGDAAFQEKCLNTMDGVAKVGRTVLLVSHNMQAIQQLCTRAFLIQQGRLAASGPPAGIIERYLGDYFSNPVPEPVLFNDQLLLEDITFIQDEFQISELANNNKPLQVRVRYEILKAIENPLLGFDVVAADGTHIFRTYDMLNCGLGTRDGGKYESIYEIPANAFQAGTYYFELVIGVHRHGWLTRNEIRMKLDFDGLRADDVWFPGVINPIGSWKLKRLSTAPRPTFPSGM